MEHVPVAPIINQRWPASIAGTPLTELLLAEAFDDLGTGMAGQRTVVPFVETRVTDDLNEYQIYLPENQPLRVDSAPQHRYKREIEAKASLC